MNDPQPAMAERIAQAARDFQRRITGHAPEDVKVVLNDKTLVITLYEALTAAERALSQSSEGAARVREFHQQLFAMSAGFLREEIANITGVPVHEAITQVATQPGSIVQVFTSGTMVQVFELAQAIPTESWNRAV